ncbi:MAG: cob(I)yrinic acid a,c-diamide adenosyltransferase [Pontiella sp.]
MDEKRRAQLKHKFEMAHQKERVDNKIAAATEERGIVIVITGNGKGKTTSAFGMIMRCLGYGHKVGLVQFIKGVQQSGEELFIRNNYPDLPFYQMGTGFTWNTQDRSGDIAAAKKTWEFSAKLLKDESLHLVVLDELTYMLGYKYLDEEMVIDTIRNRPKEQTVVITGRGGGNAIRELADTVSEIESVKHAFESCVKAREGIDY